jgi:anti-anti-sigma factor
VAAGEQLRVDVLNRADAALVQVDGELDLASSPLLETSIDSAEVAAAETVVLDLRGVKFIDSTGLRAIFGAHSRATERGQQFAVTRGSEQVQRLLSITRMGEHLRIVDSPEEVLGHSG